MNQNSSSSLPILNQVPSPVDAAATDESIINAAPVKRLPRWLKREVPRGNADHFTSKLLEELNLETVCDNAKCPNRMECYSQKTATFMILGNVCTRPCGFCAVKRGRPEQLEVDEPDRLAEAAHRLGLKHVVITSVTRDDLSDGGADHYVQCIEKVRERSDATLLATKRHSIRLSMPDRMFSITTPKRYHDFIVASVDPSRFTNGRWKCFSELRIGTRKSKPKVA